MVRLRSSVNTAATTTTAVSISNILVSDSIERRIGNTTEGL